MHRILVGSHTNEIYTLDFSPHDTVSESSFITVSSSIAAGYHPSWITPHPDDRSLIFSLLQQEEGRVVAVKYNENGEGEVVGTALSGGASPPSILASTRELFVAHNPSGTVSTIPISSQPPYILASEPSSIVKLEGHGPNLTRQECAHPHQVVLHPERQELLVPDLGSDKVWRFLKDLQGVWKPMGHVPFTPGSGPRHVALYRDMLYTICELSNTVCAHVLPALPEEPTLLATAPTMEHPLPLPNDMLASEILIPPPNMMFPTPSLYVSNRNDPSSEGDTIAIFDITEPKDLRLVAEVRTGLKHVRAMEFGGPDDCWLIVGGMIEGGVKIFERVQGGRGLKLVAEKQDVKTPTGFLWL